MCIIHISDNEIVKFRIRHNQTSKSCHEMFCDLDTHFHLTSPLFCIKNIDFEIYSSYEAFSDSVFVYFLLSVLFSSRFLFFFFLFFKKQKHITMQSTQCFGRKVNIILDIASRSRQQCSSTVLDKTHSFVKRVLTAMH
jgi:hypothetical protein